MTNIAIIGCGGIGHVHAKSIKQLDNLTLSYVCDIDAIRAKTFSSLYEAEAVTDFKELLKNPDLDAISIAVPHYLHMEVFREACKNNIHIISEKPLGIYPEELAEMKQLDASTQNICSGIFQHRFSPMVMELQKGLEAGYFGEVLEIDVDFECERTVEYYDADEWRGTWKFEGGGTLINQGIHTIDLMSAFMNDAQPVSIVGKAERQRLENIEVEDCAEATVFYANEVKAQINARNVVGGGWKPKIKVTGTKGSFSLFDSEELIDVQSCDETFNNTLRDFKNRPIQDETSLGKVCYGNNHTLNFFDFGNAITNKSKPLITINKAVIANEIVLGIYHSTATNAKANFPIQNYQQPNLNKVTLV
ncbi:MAG: hypothetical protein COA79_18935 [Planctomycetota bacterium]|nr:MAG: hypothetical protein COA79_18935 [Planctomycetota bacterium]